METIRTETKNNDIFTTTQENLCSKCDYEKQFPLWRADPNHWINSDNAVKVEIPNTIALQCGPIRIEDVNKARGSCGHCAVADIISRLQPNLKYNLHELTRVGSAYTSHDGWSNEMSDSEFDSALVHLTKGKLRISEANLEYMEFGRKIMYSLQPTINDVEQICIDARKYIAGFRGLRVTVVAECVGHYINIWPTFEENGTLHLEISDNSESTLANYFSGSYDVPSEEILDQHRFKDYEFHFITEEP